MSNSIIAWLEAELAKFKAAAAPEIKTVENDAHEAVSAAWAYIKTNGLHDLYQLCLAALPLALPGASWTATLAGIEAQAVADGKQLVSGATAIVAAQAQADLIAAGKLLPPAPSPAA